MGFKEDYKEFIQFINNAKDDALVKEEYLKMAKKYHPDTAPSNCKSIYNEFMILINKAYSQGKTNVKEIKIEKEEIKKSKNRFYSFNDYYGKERKFSNYLDYLMLLGIEEYNSGLLVLNYGNYEDLYIKHTKFIPNNKSFIYEAMQHFYNAAKCFNYIINENPEYIFISDAREQFEKVTRLNNDLSLNILKSNNKEII